MSAAILEYPSQARNHPPVLHDQPPPRTAEPTAAPDMLMIAHCLPQPTGATPRQRAWNLVHAAARSHQLWLVALADGPVHLHQWDAVAALCHKFVLLPQARAARQMRKLQQTLSDWNQQTTFNAAVATTAPFHRLIPHQVRWRICDSAQPDDNHIQVLGPTPLHLPRQHTQLLDNLMRRIAANPAGINTVNIAHAA